MLTQQQRLCKSPQRNFLGNSKVKLRLSFRSPHSTEPTCKLSIEMYDELICNVLNLARQAPRQRLQSGIGVSRPDLTRIVSQAVHEPGSRRGVRSVGLLANDCSTMIVRTYDNLSF
jgi:hypothetical protein